MADPHVQVFMTGHRKSTARYCFTCKAAGLEPWHATHRGTGERDCPFEAEPPTREKAPVYIAPGKLGITNGRPRPRKQIHLSMADLMPVHIPEMD